MREFLIRNEKGVTHNLQYTDVFLYKPTGLGLQNSNSYMSANGYFIKTNEKQGQLQKSGTLVISSSATDDAYSLYKEFVDFLMSAKQLTLGYKPNDKLGWYYQDIDLVSITKTEKTKYGVLEVPIAFVPVSPFYAIDNTSIDIDGDALGGKKYEIPITIGDKTYYSYQYDYTYVDTARAGSTDKTIEAQMPCDFELEITTPIQNPVLTVSIKDTDEVIGRVDLSATEVVQGQKLTFSTVPTNAGARITRDGIETNINHLIGINREIPVFFQIPPNTECTYTLTANSLEGVRVDISVRRYYRSI